MNYYYQKLYLGLLDTIYNKTKNSNSLVFYGGSYLRFAHKLNRKLNDIDFQTEIKVINIHELNNKLREFFINQKVNIINDTVEIYDNGTFYSLIYNLEGNLSVSQLKVDINIDDRIVLPKETILIKENNLKIPVTAYTKEVIMSCKICTIILRTFDHILKCYKNLDTKSQVELWNRKKFKDSLDILWFINSNVIPNFSYIKHRNIQYKTYGNLLDEVYQRISKNISAEVNFNEILFDSNKKCYVNTDRLENNFFEYYKANKSIVI